MSEQKKPEVRSDEPELNDEALEQVAGGCQWGESVPILPQIERPLIQDYV